MIQKGRPSNRSQKLISRQVYMAVTKPPPTIEYLNWSGQPIGFTQEDDPPQVSRPGQSSMILPAVIEGYEVSRIFVDGGSSLNLMYADTLPKMNISLANLTPTDTRVSMVLHPRSQIILWARFYWTYYLEQGKTSEMRG